MWEKLMENNRLQVLSGVKFVIMTTFVTTLLTYPLRPKNKSLDVYLWDNPLIHINRTFFMILLTSLKYQSNPFWNLLELYSLFNVKESLQL